MRTLYGGFDKVGATKNDFKNFKRDLNMYISEFDADMMIKRLMRKKEYMPNFSMEYITTEDGVLRVLFWADEDAKRNFSVFGDVVSFDATYRRNKYNMMFVPFTSIDNHNRNVTLGAAIIGHETAETYSWLLNVFHEAFGRAPPVIVTDQDPAMKKAIEDTWPESRHRLCMWHIMDNLSAKVGATICNNTDFKKRLCAIVWTDSILPVKFESEWATIMNDFNLVDHEWLQSLIKSGILGYRLIIVRRSCPGLCIPLLVQRVRTISLDSSVTRVAHLSNFSGILILLLKLRGMSIGRMTMTPEIPMLKYGLKTLFWRIKRPGYTHALYFLTSTWRYKTIYIDVLSESGKTWLTSLTFL
ncbi:putative MULE transposase domain, FHY3/FAR1 family [Helianthus anomalus]